MATGLVDARGMDRLSSRSGGPLADLVLLALLLAGLGMLIVYGRQAGGGYDRAAVIDLSPAALPEYAAMSLSRCLAAFLLSLGFTMVWGSIAAHSRRAERIMIPALDVLQTIPVLSFLPPVTLALISLVPGSEIGLELACILMIFTGQAWNMAFGFYQSIRSIPPALYEVARVNGFGPMKTFLRVELPGSTIGLIYNSMMSFAGGWFFLTTIEMFTLGNRDFRLPGLGSWLATAGQQHDWGLVGIGSLVLIVLIVGTDQLLFRPLLVWAQRFKIEDQEDRIQPRSWLVTLFRRSTAVRTIRYRLTRRRQAREARRARAAVHREPVRRRSARGVGPRATRHAGLVLRWSLCAMLVALTGWGLFALLGILRPLPLSGDDGAPGWTDVLAGLGLSLLRVVAVLVIGSIWTIPLGLVIGRSVRARAILGPIIQVVASYPAPAYFVLITVWLTSVGTPFWFIAPVLMLLGSQWYILFNAMGGATSIPAEFSEMARVYRMSRWTRLCRVDLPAMFPYLITGWVTAAGGAWNTTIVAEYVQTGTGPETVRKTPGIGELIATATDAGNYPLLAASTLSLAVFVIVFNRLVWHRLYRLSSTRFNLQT